MWLILACQRRSETRKRVWARMGALTCHLSMDPADIGTYFARLWVLR